MTQHFACTDIHGSKEAYDWIMSKMPKDYTLFFLGDAADRGKDGYGIMKNLLSNSNIVYLKGNHEDLFIDAALEMYDSFEYDEIKNMPINDLMNYGNSMRLYAYNGGAPTFKSWIKDGAPMSIIHSLIRLPFKAHYREYDMCHAGCTIKEWERHDEKAMLWSREHFDDEWYSNRVLIHGHTPVSTIVENLCEPLVFTYSNSSAKINIDTGAIFSGVVTLFNLDNRVAVMNKNEA